MIPTILIYLYFMIYFLIYSNFTSINNQNTKEVIKRTIKGCVTQVLCSYNNSLCYSSF